jgi:glycosyltransferase involved in cell wall biosynthesis
MTRFFPEKRDSRRKAFNHKGRGMEQDILKQKISAIIVVRNEERKIRRCLESLRWLDEIVIVDQSSTDNTVAICKEYTDKVFVVEPKGYCEPDRALAVSKTTNDWVIYLDADETIPEELKNEIVEKIAGNNRFDSYYIPRKNYFLDEWVRGSGWYPGYVLRFFDKHRVSFSTDIHTDVKPLTAPGYLKNAIMHNTCDNLDEYLYKMNSYTSILASQAYTRGERITRRSVMTKFIFYPFVLSGYKFFFKAGFRDRFNGFLIAFLTFLTVFVMNAKLWELQKKAKFEEAQR